ncbi:MAG: aminotransferase class I/II-fold pyridoxal phosphate-dependent enzyme [Oscillospiraceae bacterium]|nr:aminotransferase class I/II-fold pyridoxal phosphate-dependent enzyme [Oscillospiraceae bacterium]
MDDVISLGVGEPDFKTPLKIREETIHILEKGNTFYTSNAGDAKLREEISKYLKRKINVDYNPADEVLVTVGGSEGIDLCIRCLVEPGDEVLVVEPSFVCYSPIVKMSGGKVVNIVTKKENEFKLTANELKEAITSKTKLLILPFPNNPTGAIMKKDDLKAIAKVLKETNILVLSDEIYSELTYSSRHVSITEIDGMKERTIIINGFSKAFAMTGWRLGYAVGHRDIITQMLKLHQYSIMCAPTISQMGAIKALQNCEDEVAAMRKEYDIRRKYIVNKLNDIGLDCFEPLGGFYAFPDIRSTNMSSEKFCQKLLESEKVAVVPGNAFGSSGEGFVRISYCYSMNHIMEAMSRIDRFVKNLKLGEKSL